MSSNVTAVVEESDAASDAHDFLGIPFELLVVICVAEGCCVLVCVAFVCGYRRGKASAKEQRTEAEIQSASDFERIRELEMALERAKKDTVSLTTTSLKVHKGTRSTATTSTHVSEGAKAMPSSTTRTNAQRMIRMPVVTKGAKHELSRLADASEDGDGGQQEEEDVCSDDFFMSVSAKSECRFIKTAKI